MCKTPFMAALALGFASVVSSGCGSTSPTSPTTAGLQGEWSGSTCAPSNIVSCSIVLRLDQAGTTLSGTWGRTASNGTLSGTVSGRAVVLDLALPGKSTAVSTMTLSVQGDVMAGSSGTGTVRLTRNP